MLISVKERTHELGIRKAIGATPGSLLRLILTESVLVTGFFGYIGMFLGVVATEYLDKISQNMVMDVGLFKMTVFKDPTVGLGVCLGATLLLVVAGTLAGLAPARRAAHVRPIEALRAE
jgi:putative ABC transport system permease protein